jgi:phage tail P2-like protein
MLLPPNATPTELVLEDLASRLSDVPVPVSTIWNPRTCPADTLPWLAWALSVDFWNSEWTEEVKREVIANSYAVHARKGTPGALKRALAPLGLRINLREWFDHGGDPHTFGLTATVVPGNPATQSVQRDLVWMVDATKPARSHLTDLRFVADFGQGLGIGGVGLSAAISERSGLTQGRTGFDGQIRLASAMSPIQQQSRDGLATGRQKLLGDAWLSTVLVGATGIDGGGIAAGRNTLMGEVAAAVTVDGLSSIEAAGVADGRRDFDLAAPLAGAVSAFQAAEFTMPNEDNMGSRIILSGASFQDMTITAVNGAVVLIQGGKSTFIIGRPAQPDIQQVGLVTGAVGASTVTFAGVAGVLVSGDRVILNAAHHTVTAVAGSTITINPPLEADMDGMPAMRFREGA